jgi:uncharacterized membrane protein
MQLDKITKVACYFLAIPMIVFGIQHFIYAEFVVGLVPTWIPGGLFWTYFSGAALFAAGIGIFFNVLSRLAATLLGAMIFVWVVVLHIPRVFENPGDSNEFINVFDALMMGGGAFIFAQICSGKSPLEKLTSMGAKVSPFLIAISLMVFGIEHLIHGRMVFIVGAASYPVPGAPFLSYFSGIIFILAAIGIFFSKRSSSIAAFLGIFILLITLLFYLPQVVTSIFWDHALSTMLKGIAMSGSAFAYSRARSVQQRETFESQVMASNS